VFDRLKNKGLDRSQDTISIIQCLISKLFMRLDKLDAKGFDKNVNSFPNQFFFPPNIIQIQNLFNTLKFVLCCFVLYSSIQYLYFVDQIVNEVDIFVLC
jgi:hypothetical protein